MPEQEERTLRQRLADLQQTYGANREFSNFLQNTLASVIQGLEDVNISNGSVRFLCDFLHANAATLPDDIRAFAEEIRTKSLKIAEV